MHTPPPHPTFRVSPTRMVVQASIEKRKGGVAAVKFNGGPVSPGVELERAPVQVAS